MTVERAALQESARADKSTFGDLLDDPTKHRCLANVAVNLHATPFRVEWQCAGRVVIMRSQNNREGFPDYVFHRGHSLNIRIVVCRRRQDSGLFHRPSELQNFGAHSESTHQCGNSYSRRPTNLLNLLSPGVTGDQPSPNRDVAADDPATPAQPPRPPGWPTAAATTRGPPATATPDGRCSRWHAIVLRCGHGRP